MLPEDKQARKNIPLYRGLFCYFPDALCAVAELSRIGNDQHNPGEPLHWAREKSTDENDALLRHMMDKASGVPIDTDRVRHATKVAWRSLATLQKEIEADSLASLTVPEMVMRSQPSAMDLEIADQLAAPVRTETHVPCREDRICADCGDPVHGGTCADAWATARRHALAQAKDNDDVQ